MWRSYIYALPSEDIIIMIKRKTPFKTWEMYCEHVMPWRRLAKQTTNTYELTCCLQNMTVEAQIDLQKDLSRMRVFCR